MKKLAIILVSFVLFASVISAAGCSSTSAAGTGTGTTTASAAIGATTTTAPGTTEKTFTLDELKTYDGLNGNLAYVAVNGVVYDVTNAKNWSNGTHQTHSAGQDLSSVIASAPHGTSVLAGLTVVGKLVP